MKNLPPPADARNRHSIRIKDFDYREAGAYFVTMCTQDKKHLFGEISNGEIKLNEAGRIVPLTWDNLPGRFPNINWTNL